MYRNGEIYDEIAKTVIQIFLDYNIRKFPVDEKDLCRKMGVKLVGYSSIPKEKQIALKKISFYGFFAPESRNNTASIYYNDTFGSKAGQRTTIFHELKHYVYEDEDEEEDDLADYFSKYFMCPIPYLLLKDVDSVNEVMSEFGTSFMVAESVCSNLINRRKKYGYHLFEYETKLIEHLEPALLKYVDK